MKKLLTLAIILISLSSFAQLTLSEKAALARKESFQIRIYQGLFSKANFWLSQPVPTSGQANSLHTQKKINFAYLLSKTSAYDSRSITSLWLANYNGVQILDGNNEPIDSQILNTSALDVVYDLLAGVVAGDSTKAAQ